MIIQRIEHNRRRLPAHVHVCQSTWETARGLLARPTPDERTAWLLTRCGAIHTIGLLQPIDVVYCDADGRILRVVNALQPFRFSRCKGARQVWEWRAGTIARLNLQPGDRLLPCC